MVLDLSNIRFGVCSWGISAPDYSNLSAFENVCSFVRELPFPDQNRRRYVEILGVLPDGKQMQNIFDNADKIKKLGNDYDLDVVVTGFIPNMSGAAALYDWQDEKRGIAIDLVKRGIDLASMVGTKGGRILAGPTWTVHEKFPESIPSNLTMKGNYSVLKGAVLDLCTYAADMRVTYAPEPLNHDETVTVLEPGNVAFDFAQEVRRHKSNFALNLDTVHYAQHSSGNFVDSIVNAVKNGQGGVLHLCEHNRKEFGRGDIGYRTRELFEKIVPVIPQDTVLRVGLENFIPGLNRSLRIWRPDFYVIKESDELESCKNVVRNGVEYLNRVLSN